MPFIDLARQHDAVGEAVRARIDEVIRSQRFVLGEPVEELEAAIAELCGVRHGVGVASGTDALLLPLRALDLERGDEVITTPFTFFATAGAIHNAGATPVFVDIEPDTFNLSPDAVRAAITPRTRAIVPVHLFGQMANMAALCKIADEAGLFVLEDAAQSIGARQRVEGAWRAPGQVGDAAAFSFFPTKNLGGYGDGGMVVTDNDTVAARLRRLRVHGGLQMYHHEEVGTNSRLDALQAAVLLAKLPYLEGWNAARREHAAAYHGALAPLETNGYLRRPTTRSDSQSVFNLYTVRARRRDALQSFMRTEGVGTAVYYPVPLHLQPCFEHLGHGPGDLPESERAARDVLSIPIFAELSPPERARVVAVMETFWASR